MRYQTGLTVAVLAAAALLISGRALKELGCDRYEYSLLLLFAALGGGVMLSANNLRTMVRSVPFNKSFAIITTNI